MTETNINRYHNWDEIRGEYENGIRKETENGDVWYWPSDTEICEKYGLSAQQLSNRKKHELDNKGIDWKARREIAKSRYRAKIASTGQKAMIKSLASTKGLLSTKLAENAIQASDLTSDILEDDSTSVKDKAMALEKMNSILIRTLKYINEMEDGHAGKNALTAIVFANQIIQEKGFLGKKADTIIDMPDIDYLTDLSDDPDELNMNQLEELIENGEFEEETNDTDITG